MFNFFLKGERCDASRAFQSSLFLSALILSAWKAKVSATSRGNTMVASAYTWSHNKTQLRPPSNLLVVVVAYVVVVVVVVVNSVYTQRH